LSLSLRHFSDVAMHEVMSKYTPLPSHIINRVKWLTAASTVYQAARFRKQAEEMPDPLR
jgi:hypothetical protein